MGDIVSDTGWINMTDNRFTEAAETWLKQRFPEYQKDTSVMHVDVEVYLAGAARGYAEGKAERDQLKAAIESWKREEQDWHGDMKELRTRLEDAEKALKVIVDRALNIDNLAYWTAHEYFSKHSPDSAGGDV
jgi:hypothetical protein